MDGHCHIARLSCVFENVGDKRKRDKKQKKKSNRSSPTTKRILYFHVRCTPVGGLDTLLTLVRSLFSCEVHSCRWPRHPSYIYIAILETCSGHLYWDFRSTLPFRWCQNMIFFSLSFIFRWLSSSFLCRACFMVSIASVSKITDSTKVK